MSATRPLGELLRAHYASRTLRDSTLARLRAMERAHPHRRLPSRRAVWVTTAAGLAGLIVIVAGLLLPYRTPSPTRPPADLAREVIDEVRRLHLSAAPPEIARTEAPDLEAMSERLGFTPHPPAPIAGDGLTLAGADYVEILGRPAARLTLVDEAGEVTSLFQMSGRDVPVSGGRELTEGTYVRLWHEDDLLMALARRAR